MGHFLFCLPPTSDDHIFRVRTPFGVFLDSMEIPLSQDSFHIPVECNGCHAPIPDPTRMANPNRVRARDYILGLIDLFFLRAELVPVVIQTISVITKIIFIYKRTTTGVVSLNIYIHILSPIYLYMYIFFSNTKHQRSQKQCGEHLSLSRPALLI